MKHESGDRRSALVRSVEAVVVGAGLSGLAVAAALRRRDIPCLVLEREGKVGSAWQRRHPQLHLNTHRWLSQLPGLRYPGGAPAFPHRDDVVRYLQAYAAGLDVPIEFDSEVRSMSRTDSHWLLQTRHGVRLARHVVIATGRDSVPWIPEWPGLADYRGEFLHAAGFGDAFAYAGRSVLVIGGGNSAVDVMNHLSRAGASELWLSIRTPPAIMPMRVSGVPLHPVTAVLARLPVRAQDLALRLTQWTFYRDLPRLGLPRPQAGGATRLAREGVVPAVDDGFVQALRQGRIRVLPELAAFDQLGVRFTDGSRVQPDVVIAATGYRPGLERLAGPLGALGTDGLPLQPCGSPDPAQPGLWFTGMRPSAAGYFVAARQAAERMASSIARER